MVEHGTTQCKGSFIQAWALMGCVLEGNALADGQIDHYFIFSKKTVIAAANNNTSEVTHIHNVVRFLVNIKVNLPENQSKIDYELAGWTILTCLTTSEVQSWQYTSPTLPTCCGQHWKGETDIPKWQLGWYSYMYLHPQLQKRFGIANISNMLTSPTLNKRWYTAS